MENERLKTGVNVYDRIVRNRLNEALCVLSVISKFNSKH